MALCCAVEPGSRELAALVDRHGAEAVWRSLLKPGSPSRWAARAQRLDLAAVGRATERFRLRFVIPGDDDWPGGLSDLADCEPVQDLGGAPFGLWVKGQMALVEAVARSVSIVGARACTAYGQTVTTDLAAGLGTHGITVISGAPTASTRPRTPVRSRPMRPPLRSWRGPRQAVPER